MFRNITISIAFYILSLFISNRYFNNYIYAVIFCTSLWWNIFGYKYFQYWVLRHKNYNAKLLYKNRIIPYIEYGNFKVLSKNTTSITFEPWFLGFLCMPILLFLFCMLIFGSLQQFWGLMLYLFLGCIGLSFRTKDIKNYFEILKNSSTHLYAIFKVEDVSFSEDEEINYKYKDILFYREIYKDMSLEDLKNELILINQKINDKGKFNFFTLCLIPAILAIVGGIFSVISTMLAYDLVHTNASKTVGVYLYVILVFIIFLFYNLFLINRVFTTGNKNLSMQKTIIEECIEEKNI